MVDTEVQVDDGLEWIPRDCDHVEHDPEPSVRSGGLTTPPKSLNGTSSRSSSDDDEELLQRASRFTDQVILIQREWRRYLTHTRQMNLWNSRGCRLVAPRVTRVIKTAGGESRRFEVSLYKKFNKVNFEFSFELEAVDCDDKSNFKVTVYANMRLPKNDAAKKVYMNEAVLLELDEDYNRITTLKFVRMKINL